MKAGQAVAPTSTAASPGEGVRPPVDVFTTMRKRRMHRFFSHEPLEREVVEQLVWATGRAPTGRPGMRQIMVIDDPALLDTLHQCCPGFVNDAPMAVLIFSDLNEAGRLIGLRGQEVVARLDAGQAAAYLSLAAPALGLGMLVTTSWSEAAVQEILDLPEHCRPEVLLAVGKIAATPSRAIKGKPPIVHENGYGRPWEPTNAK